MQSIDGDVAKQAVGELFLQKYVLEIEVRNLRALLEAQAVDEEVDDEEA